MTTTTTPVTAPGMPEEVVTRTPVQDVALPGGAGILALVTLDNGHDHTRPNTFGPQTIAGLQATVDGLRARAEAGEIAAVGITGKPFVFAVGADLSGVPYVTEREQALAIARAGHAAFASIMDLPVPTFAFVNGAAMGGGVEIALACDYRTVSYGVPAFALPETFLGLVPGWGGCFMLPNLDRRRRRPQGHHREPVVAEPDAQGQGGRGSSASPTCCSSRPTSSRTRCAGPPPCSPAPFTVQRREVDTDEASLGCRVRRRPQGRARQDRRPRARRAARRRAGAGRAHRRPATTPSPPRMPRSAT